MKDEYWYINGKKMPVFRWKPPEMTEEERKRSDEFIENAKKAMRGEGGFWDGSAIWDSDSHNKEK